MPFVKSYTYIIYLTMLTMYYFKSTNRYYTFVNIQYVECSQYVPKK